MSGLILAAAGAALVPPLASAGWAALYRRSLRRRFRFYPGWISSAAFMGVSEAVQRQWIAVAVSAANILLAALLWWLSRRRRKRAPKLAGAKSRALLAAVVRTMRERSRPRPVLRPVPGGAR